ncbi:LysR family transcriptional regulator [Sphingomonas sp. CL5.1]|uniref:LysR family transcriptional regulator n=1 Tax=Sphingomonas sp. CL5.1 TaxID=2653203 RepID=UPI001C2ECBF5|nr:LysR family transcriptional regulator [Sphingomonas sp. CL5.1]
MNGVSVHMLIRKVDLLTLRLFLAAIEERQIGRAAALENIAASAATKRIHDLEETVGIKLLERNPKGVVPSHAGQVLAHRLKQMFSSLEDARRELSEFSTGERGHVRVGATPAIIIQHIARELGEFKRNFPFIDVDIQEGFNPANLRAVRNGEVDIAVFISLHDVDRSGLTTIPYRSDKLVAVYPIGHAFSEKSSVTLDDLLEEKLIGIHPDTSLMQRLREATRALGRELEPAYNVSSVEAARSLVEFGLGVTIQPECMLSIEDFERIATVAIAEPWAVRQFEIATPAGKPLSSAAELLMRQLTGRAAYTEDGRDQHALAVGE